MGTEHTNGGFTPEERAFIQAQADFNQSRIDETQYTDEERLIIDAFNTALDDFGKDPEIDTLREKIRVLCGVDPKSPFDLLILGFCMGFDKGMAVADGLLKIIEATT